MPNIEICGFGFENALKLREKIVASLEEISLEKEAVTSIIDNVVVHDCVCNVRCRPYIRICSTDRNEIDQIIAVFKKNKIGVDTEFLKLTGFIPALEMK